MDPRDRQLNIGLTRAEFEIVRRRSEAAGLRPVDYGRAALVGGSAAAPTGAAAPRPAEQALFLQLKRLGNLLNQIVRHCHITQGPVPESLEPLLREIRAAASRSFRLDRQDL